MCGELGERLPQGPLADAEGLHRFRGPEGQTAGEVEALSVLGPGRGHARALTCRLPTRAMAPSTLGARDRVGSVPVRACL